VRGEGGGGRGEGREGRGGIGRRKACHKFAMLDINLTSSMQLVI